MTDKNLTSRQESNEKVYFQRAWSDELYKQGGAIKVAHSFDGDLHLGYSKDFVLDYIKTLLEDKTSSFPYFGTMDFVEFDVADRDKVEFGDNLEGKLVARLFIDKKGKIRRAKFGSKEIALSLTGKEEISYVSK